MADMIYVSKLDLLVALSWAREVIDPEGEPPEPQQMPIIKESLDRIEKALEAKD